MAIAEPAPAPQLGETVAEAVRRQILDAVLFGDLASPARLYPAELAARFGVSITPVREALARLAADGFIEAVPRHGFHVRTPSPDHVAEDHADEGRDGQQPGESAPTSADGEKDEEIDDRQKRYPEKPGRHANGQLAAGAIRPPPMHSSPA